MNNLTRHCSYLFAQNWIKAGGQFHGKPMSVGHESCQTSNQGVKGPSMQTWKSRVHSELSVKVKDYNEHIYLIS